MLSLEQRLDKIEEVIKKPSFRQNKGLGNEVGYYIFDYPAEQELVVRERIEYIRQKNEEAIDGFRIVVFDLYDIIERTPANSVVFITGIGKCYPLLRSHTVLNNLHQVIDSVPVVMFYPGEYDGQELVLFGEIKDDNYYRAFKLVD